MRIHLTPRALLLAALIPMCQVRAQTIPTIGAPTNDPVIQKIYDEGMKHSQAYPLAQVPMASIGPRLTGSPANRPAKYWLVSAVTAWGIPAKNEKYDTWRDWSRGQSRFELSSPRTRTL